jgi:hypothetical protein
LKYFTYHSVVLVLAPNYKQHILSPAKVREVCYSVGGLYVKSVYLNLFKWRRDFHETLQGGRKLLKFGKLSPVIKSSHGYQSGTVDDKY